MPRTIKATPVRRIPVCVLALTAWISFGDAASAQGPGASIDAGALNLQYADSIEANAFAITPSLWAESELTSLSATGTLSQFTAGGWSAQGTADASLFTRRLGFLLGEFQGTGGGSTRNDGSRTGQLLAIARAHLTSANQGVWIGAGLGRTWDGSIWRNLRQAEGAAWIRFGSTTAFASATPVVVDDSIRYTDAQLSASINLQRLELTGSAGFRGGSSLPTLGGTAKSWGSASITGWIASRLAIVGSAGTYPVDLTQGFPGGRFASVSLRLGTRRNTPEMTRSLPDTDTPRRIARSAAFVTKPAPEGKHEIRIHAPGATTVEVMGDFTSWETVRMSDAGSDWWTIALPITTGIHEINVRLNKGPWTTPPGLMGKRDESGGSVGVFVIR